MRLASSVWMTETRRAPTAVAGRELPRYPENESPVQGGGGNNGHPIVVPLLDDYPAMRFTIEQ